MKINKKFRIAIMASGNGTNAEAIMLHFAGHPAIEVVVVLTNNPNAYVLVRSERHGVPTMIFDRDQFPDQVLARLVDDQVTHIVLAGFLRLLPRPITAAYPNRIINIHPALLPGHGGKGMYGMRVHESVKKAGEPETGITIHLVNDEYDKGPVLYQQRCAVAPSDSPEEIARKVHMLEHDAYPRVIENWILGKVPETSSGL